MSMIAVAHLRRGDRLAMGGEVSRREPRSRFERTHTFFMIHRTPPQSRTAHREVLRTLNSHRPHVIDEAADGGCTIGGESEVVVLPHGYLVEVTNR